MTAFLITYSKDYNFLKSDFAAKDKEIGFYFSAFCGIAVIQRLMIFQEKFYDGQVPFP